MDTGQTLDWAGATERIYANTSSHNLYFQTNGLNQLTVDINGNVGIGTTTPYASLSVAGASLQSNDIFAISTSSATATSTVFRVLADGTTKILTQGSSIPLAVTFGGTSVNNFSTMIADANLKISAGSSANLVLQSSNGGSATPITFQINASEKMRLNSDGNFGIGTTTPWAMLSVGGGNIYPTSPLLFAIASSTSSATSTFLGLDNQGFLSMGVGAATTTSVGNTIANSAIFSVDANTSTTTISNLAIGNLVFDTNAGVVNLSDIPVDANAANGTVQSQTINIGGNPVLTVYGIADGTGTTTSLSVGIGTTTPTAQLSTTGTVRFSAFGAGTLTTDASGNLSVSSDERLKDVSGEFTRGLSDIEKLTPILYHWNATSSLDMSTQYAGFSAQNVQKAIPEAVGMDGRGYLTLQDRPIMATIVNAIKELNAKVGSSTAMMIAGAGGAVQQATIGALSDVLASFRTLGLDIAQNMVHVVKMVADNFQVGSREHPTGITMYDTITNDPYCFQMVRGVATTTPGVCPDIMPQQSADIAPAQVPVISVQGANPATISVGSTYSDLGAIITAPASALNLGISALVDGGATTTLDHISIDTTVAGTHTVEYRVIDQHGVMGTATRTIEVVTPDANASQSASVTQNTI